jgi:hypothetical protein
VYTFRFRGSNREEGEDCKSNHAGQDDFIYGYAFFSRRKDESSTRGYDQVINVFLDSIAVTDVGFVAFRRNSFSSPLAIAIHYSSESFRAHVLDTWYADA